MGLLRALIRERKQDPEVEQHLAALREDGFAHVRCGFPDGLVAQTLARVKEFLRSNAAIFDPHRDEHGHYPRIVNLHAACEPLLSLFTANRLALAVQDAWFGSPSCIYTSLYFERGSAQPIHRDSPYFATKPEGRYLGVWVALEDADESNGCLQVVRRGHLVPELDREAIALELYARLEDVPPDSQELWDAYQAKMLEACLGAGLTVEPLAARMGDVIIWHAQLPHGGSPIRDLARTRHSFVMHVTPEGVPVYQQDVFFNPGKRVPERARWSYASFRGRKYVRAKEVDIGHRERRSVREFVR